MGELGGSSPKCNEMLDFFLARNHASATSCAAAYSNFLDDEVGLRMSWEYFVHCEGKKFDFCWSFFLWCAGTKKVPFTSTPSRLDVSDDLQLTSRSSIIPSIASISNHPSANVTTIVVVFLCFFMRLFFSVRPFLFWGWEGSGGFHAATR